MPSPPALSPGVGRVLLRRVGAPPRLGLCALPTRDGPALRGTGSTEVTVVTVAAVAAVTLSSVAFSVQEPPCAGTPRTPPSSPDWSTRTAPACISVTRSLRNGWSRMDEVADSGVKAAVKGNKLTSGYVDEESGFFSDWLGIPKKENDFILEHGVMQFEGALDTMTVPPRVVLKSTPAPGMY